MRLYELSRPPSRYNAEVVLMKAGYRELGSGSSATVWQKPGASYVLKVFDPRDQAYAAFVKLAQANPSPHYPRFFGKIVPVTEWYSAIRTERLTPYTGSLEDLQLIDKYIMKKRDSMQGMNGDWSDAYQFVSKQPELQAACDALAKLLLVNSRTFFCDLHDKNVMMRGSTIVLSDPLGTSSIF